MASSKTLFRAGASMATRFLNRAFHTSPTPLLSPKPELIAARKLLPSLFVPQFQKMAPFQFPQSQNDVDSLQKLNSEGFLYPSGLPSLPFFLPEGNPFYWGFFLRYFLILFCYLFSIGEFELVHWACYFLFYAVVLHRTWMQLQFILHIVQIAYTSCVHPVVVSVFLSFHIIG